VTGLSSSYLLHLRFFHVTDIPGSCYDLHPTFAKVSEGYGPSY